MSIEIKIKYTDQEYLNAVREKISGMPNKTLHTFLPTVFSAVLMGVLNYFDVITSWWGITLVGLTVTYAVFSLFIDWSTPRLALYFAKRKKLRDIYTFVIDEDGITRSSESGKVEIAWSKFTSIEFFKENVFFNLEKGSMLIPLGRLCESELNLLKSYAKST